MAENLNFGRDRFFPLTNTSLGWIVSAPPANVFIVKSTETSSGRPAVALTGIEVEGFP